MSYDQNIERAKGEWLKVIYETLVRIAVALESKTSSKPIYQVMGTTILEDPYGVQGIKWLKGGGKDKKLANPDDGYAWTFIYDIEGVPHQEINKLLPALTSSGGKLETAGYEIQLGGKQNQLLIRKILKEAYQ